MTTNKKRLKKKPTEAIDAGEAVHRPFASVIAEKKKRATEEAKAKRDASDKSSKNDKRGPASHKPSPRRSVPPKSAQPADSSEAETFAAYMAGVRALDKKADRVPANASQVERKKRVPAAVNEADVEARARLASLIIEGLRFETTDDGDHVEGRRIDVEPRELRRLRRGQYAVDGKIDLHGLTLVEARQKVEAFVKKRATDGDRVVLIVHGKGSHSPRGAGVLRGEIGAWLSQGRASRHVAAFSSAPDDMGGSGAVLVLLAR